MQTRLVPSSHAIGYSFERLTLSFLSSEPFYFNLNQVGGKGDDGIDLRGTIPPLYNPKSNQSKVHRVIVQCKAESTKLGPVILRELEGTLDARLDTSQQKKSEIIGILVSKSGFSLATLLRAKASDWPLALIHLVYAEEDVTNRDVVEERKGKLISFFINEAFRRAVDDGISISTSFEFKNGKREGTPVVRWKNRII